MGRITVLLGLLATAAVSSAFHVPRSQQQRTPTSLFGLLGRFRKQRKVEQVAPIEVGATLPEIDVEKLTLDADGSVTSEPVSIRDLLGTSSKAVLVGMPGAFTPTCSKEHLPGYIQSVDKLAALGIEKVVVVTTNDRFVNEEWSRQQGLFTKNQEGDKITLLCDGDGDLVKNMGLADDMGFGIGVRSKRFAMVTENGKVAELVTDEGMDDCSSTSAEKLIERLTPKAVASEVGVDVKVLGGAASVVAVVALLATQVGGPASQPPAVGIRASPPPTQSRAERPQKNIPTKSTFSLIEQYLKN